MAFSKNPAFVMHTLCAAIIFLVSVAPLSAQAEQKIKLPNLHLDKASFSCSPDPLIGNATGFCSVKIQNMGEAAARRVIVQVDIDSNKIGQVNIGTLQKGASKTVRVPVDMYPISGGLFLFEAIAGQAAATEPHSGNALFESDEEDNYVHKNIAVLPNPPSLEIIPGSFRLVRGSLRPGKSVLLRASIRNTSKARAKDVQITLLNASSTIAERIVTIPVGTTKNVTFSWKIPKGFVGTLPLSIMIDPNHWVFSSDEQGHTSGISLKVK